MDEMKKKEILLILTLKIISKVTSIAVLQENNNRHCAILQ